MREYVNQQCCYGKGAAEQMIVENITSTDAFHYSLETFQESRIVATAFVPYNGEAVDGPQYGPPPPAWSIVAQPPG